MTTPPTTTPPATPPALRLDPRLERPDDVYEALLAAHDGLNEAESRALDARLILILANQIGDLGVLRAALAAAAPQPPGRSIAKADDTRV
jgi:hypothetical protein